MSIQLQSMSTILSVSPEKTEILTVIKNEPEIVEIGINDILDSSDEDEEIIPDIKDIDIVYHELSEDLIKSETVSENTFENKHSGSVETQVFVKTENISLIKTENIIQSEYLCKTQDISDGNVSRVTSQGVIEVQDLSDISRRAKCPNKTAFSECYKTVETTSCEKHRRKGKVIEVPVFPIQPHKYTSLAKTKHARNTNKSTHKQNKKSYCCEKCTFISKNHSYFKQHKLSHKTKAEVDSRYLKYRCDKCKFKTYWCSNLRKHKLTHLKPEEIHYFHCYHCSYKGKQKNNLQTHIFRHFKREDVPLHCYLCDFVTLKRDLIIQHFKTHPKHHSKCDETDYKNQLETYTKYRCDKCKYKSCWLSSFKTHKLKHLNPEQISHFYCYHCPYKCKLKAHLKKHIFNHFKKEEVPFHCYLCDFTTLKRDLIIEHFKKNSKPHSKCDKTDYQTYIKKPMRYCCEKCSYISEIYSDFKRHQLTHKRKAKTDRRLLKYRCDKCKFKTYWSSNLKKHKLTHLKPEEIHYFHCYHCSYKGKQKNNLQTHIFRHFKREDVLLHCYLCDFVTLKRDLIIKHFKTHPKHHSKCDETDYRNQLETYTKYYCDKCKYKSCWLSSFKAHKLKHLKPEQISYFYCYHCPFKCKLKGNLKNHIFNHFKKEEVPFHCYICDFTTLKRDLIIEHFTKHSKHHSKCDKTDY